MSAREYARTIRHIVLFLSGRKRRLLADLKKEMRDAVKELRFEDAGRAKARIRALEHVNDVALIRDDVRGASSLSASLSEGVTRIEAYDVAHLSGKAGVGVMVVIEGGEPQKGGYKRFKIRGKGKDRSDDPGNLAEVLERRLKHREWTLPSIIVVDGNDVQRSVAVRALANHGLDIPVVAVTKDERHRPHAAIGDGDLIAREKKSVLLANAEAHRFAIAYHRRLMRKRVFE